MEGFPNSHTEIHISRENFCLFHTTDRMLYGILVANLMYDPVEALQIMAIWLWLERAGFLNITKRIMQLPIALISELVDEANICLTFINNPQSLLINEASDIHLTQNLIKDFSLEYLKKNQALAKFGVETVRTKICMQAFNDMMQQAISQNEARRIAQSQQQLFTQQAILSNGSTNGVALDDQRTMFVTFSKGYPVAEWEIREFLLKNFGDCIESFYMEDVTERGGQPLYARVGFFQADMIQYILNGMPKAKFNINGKQVWMRKYVPKDQRNTNVTTPQH